MATKETWTQERNFLVAVGNPRSGLQTVWKNVKTPADMTVAELRSSIVKEQMPTASKDASVELVLDGEIPDDKKTMRELFYKRIWICVQLLPDIVVNVKSLSGSQVKLPVAGNYDVVMMMQAYYRATGTPVDLQRYVFGGQKMDEYKTLAHYNVRNNSDVHMILKLRGGGSGPVSFSDMKEKRILQWADSAPPWRHVSPGLCLEAPCKNKACAAYEKMVITNYGFTSVNLLEFRNKYETCRLCYQPSLRFTDGDATCAFNNCLWSYTGLLEDGVTIERQPWTIAGDAYVRFLGGGASQDGGKQAKWQQLVLSTKPLKQFAVQEPDPFKLSSEQQSGKKYEFIPCLICNQHTDQKNGDDETSLAGCWHIFHSRCLAVWKRVYNNNCPYCNPHLVVTV